MFSNRSAGPFFSSMRLATAPISLSQSTSAVTRRSSPAFSRRLIHSRMSMKPIVVTPSSLATANRTKLRDQRSCRQGSRNARASAANLQLQNRAGRGLMTLPRRGFLYVTACAVSLPAASRLALAQAYPSRPVRIIVGFGAGGAPDILARLIGQWLSERLGQQFIVENRPGAGSNIATEAVVHAPADGHTLLLASMGNAVNTTLYGNLNYDFLRDIAPVAGISREPLGMEVHPSFPARS